MSTPWELTGNSNTQPSTDFLGTNDASPLVIKTNQQERMRIGTDGSLSFPSPLTIKVDDAERVRIDQNNIVIRTPSLDFRGTDTTPPLTLKANGESRLTLATNGSLSYVMTEGANPSVATIKVKDGADPLLEIAADGRLNFGPDRLTVTNDGKVGIGTAQPDLPLTVEAGARLHRVMVGASPAGLAYEWDYETVGVSHPTHNLRLQSPLSIIFHTGGNPPEYRGHIDPLGNMVVVRNMGVGGQQADIPGIHTWDVVAEGGLYVGPQSNNGNPSIRMTNNGHIVAREIGTAQLTAEAGARLHRVMVGASPAGLAYEWDYETIGVSHPSHNLRLQSPLSIIFHTGGNPPQYRGHIDPSGNMVVVGNLGVGGQQADEPGIHTWDVVAEGGMYVGPKNHNGNRPIRMYNSGLFVAREKKFDIPHPVDPDNRRLVHGCIEGPEHAVFYRGEGRLDLGTAVVELPGYFEALTRTEGRTVQVTPLCNGGDSISLLAVSSVRNGRFEVRAMDQNNPLQGFYWEVKAVRADVEHLQPEPTITDTLEADRMVGAPL